MLENILNSAVLFLCGALSFRRNPKSKTDVRGGYENNFGLYALAVKAAADALKVRQSGSKVSTYDLKVSTFGSKVSTFGSKVSTYDLKVSTDNLKVSTYDLKVSTDNLKVRQSNSIGRQFIPNRYNSTIKTPKFKKNITTLFYAAVRAARFGASNVFVKKASEKLRKKGVEDIGFRFRIAFGSKSNFAS